MAVPRAKSSPGRTRKLILKYLAAWLVFGVAVHVFFGPLNKIDIPVLGIPLGLYLAAQGALIVFIVMLFVFAKRQDEREHGTD
jgi:putative solute:sodium symporter small subunit